MRYGTQKSNFRELTLVELVSVAGGNNEGEELPVSENVIIVTAERDSGGGGSGGVSTPIAIPLFLFSGTDAGEFSLQDDPESKFEYITDNQLSEADEEQLATFLETLKDGLLALADEYGHDKTITFDGKTVTLASLADTFGKVVNIIEAGNITSAALTGNEFVADAAGFIAALGVGATLAGSAPLVVFLATTGAGILTTLLVQEIIDTYGERLQNGLNNLAAEIDRQVGSTAADILRDQFNIDPFDNYVDRWSDFFDAINPAPNLRGIFEDEISYLEQYIDYDGPNPIIRPA